MKNLYSCLILMLFSQAGFSQELNFKQELTSLVQPLKAYSKELSVCDNKTSKFNKDYAELQIGFSKEKKLIAQLENQYNDYSIKLSVLGDNLQMSTDNYREENFYNIVKTALIENGLTIIYENKNLRGVPAINANSHLTIFKKRMDLQNEERKLNNYLYEVERTYNDTLSCYDKALSDDNKNALTEQKTNSLRKYAELVQEFGKLYPNKDLGNTNLFVLMTYGQLSSPHSKEYKAHKQYINELISKYNPTQQKELKEIFQIVLDNPLSRPLSTGVNPQNEVDNLYSKLLKWKLEKESVAKYYLQLN